MFHVFYAIHAKVNWKILITSFCGLNIVTIHMIYRNQLVIPMTRKYLQEDQVH
uniref:Uncharacterized protein n=1 Tax=Arundo donax TaxID=35708 RepID=A0A0A9FUF7_ARUDO